VWSLINGAADLAAQYPVLAIVIAFAAAIIEAVAVLGVLIPGTPILMAVAAAGAMAGMSMIPIMIVAIVGAVIGDFVSYWLGYRFRFRLRDMWPFATRPRSWPCGLSIATARRAWRSALQCRCTVHYWSPAWRAWRVQSFCLPCEFGVCLTPAHAYRRSSPGCHGGSADQTGRMPHCAPGWRCSRPRAGFCIASGGAGSKVHHKDTKTKNEELRHCRLMPACGSGSVPGRRSDRPFLSFSHRRKR
jgi:hypothetical protein